MAQACVCSQNLHVTDTGELCVVPGSLGLREVIVVEEDDLFCPADYPWLARVGVHAYGGGGSGGGTEEVPPTWAAEGGGGGGGGYSYSLIDVATLGGNCVPVTIGAAGVAAGDGQSGNNGGPTSFGGLVVAAGGQGGNVGLASDANQLSVGGEGGPRASGVGMIRISGGRGGNGRVVESTLAKTSYGGAAAGPHGGTAIVGSAASGSGLVGRTYGGGSAGASQSGTGDPRGSVDGGRGAVIIELYG